MIVRFLARHFRSPRQALATDHPPHIRVAECLHALESRYLFDAAGVATGAEAAVDAVAQEQAEQAVDNHFNDGGAADAGQASDPSSPADNADPNDQLLEALATHQPPADRREIVFVDTSVADHRTLIAGIDPSAEVVLLDPTRDGVEQIADVLAGRSGIDAIHIVSHGSEAELQLGTARLTLDSMSGKYADELAAIGQALTDEADILVYGCNFGEGRRGQEAVATLAAKTGADVAASEDATGSTALGGDWDLELRVGRIDTTAALTAEEQTSYMGLLATWDVHDDFNPPAYNGNDGSANWNGDWQEVNDDDDSATGLVYASGGVLNREIPVGGDSARGLWREADLSQALNATLSFDHKTTVAAVTASTTVEVQVSDDGGMSWTTVLSTTDSTLVLSDSGWVTSSVDISSYATANTRIRVLASSAGVLVLGEAVQFDNVKISYTVNDAPVANADAYAVAEDGTLTVPAAGVLANDTDVEGDPLTAVLVAGPANGALTLNADGSFSYTPNANFFGTDSFTYRANDGTVDSALAATVTLTVTPVNDAPVITSNGGGASASVSTAENTTVVTTVAATDIDVPAQTLTYSIIGGADQTLFSINSSTGELTFNTAPDFEAPADANADNVYEVSVQASDGSLTDTQALSVTVIAAAPAAPAPPGAGGGTPEGSPSAPGSGPSSDDPVAPGSEVDDGSSSKTSPVPKTTASDDSPVTVSNSRAQPAAVSRVDFRSKQGFNNDTSRDLGSKRPIAKETNAATPSAADVQDAKDPYSTLKANRFLEGLNRLRGDMNHQLSLETLALSIGLSVGYAIWLLRGGALLSSLLSSLPAWRWLDPLPVLAHLKDPRDDEEGNEDSLQAVLKTAEARDQSKPIPDLEVVPPAQQAQAATGAALSQPDATASIQEKAEVNI